MGEPLVSVVVVTLNNIPLLRGCLSSLKSQTHKNLEIILVDNGSTDDVRTFAKTEFPDAVYIRLEENAGFAGGNNVGISKAKGEYIALINNDATASEGWISAMVKAMEADGRTGQVASIILDGNNVIKVGTHIVKSIEEFINQVLSSGDNVRRSMSLWKVSHEEAVMLKQKTGLDVEGYDHTIDSYSMRHIFEKHGKASTEEPHGQIPVAREDVLMIPEIIANPDSIEYAGKTRIGADSITYQKRCNGTVYYVEELRTGRKELAAKSMYKKRAATDVPSVPQSGIGESKPLSVTSETLRPASNIGQFSGKVNNDGEILDSVGLGVAFDGMTRQCQNGKKPPELSAPSEVLMASGCACLFRGAALREVGLFDDDFFAYCEDADLGLRLRLAGWNAVAAPGAIVRHFYSMTAGKFSARKIYLVERNHFWVAVKNFPLLLLPLVPFVTVWRYFVQLFLLLSGGKLSGFVESAGFWEIAKAHLRAYRDVVLALPSMFKKRLAQGKIRRLGTVQTTRLLLKHRLSMREILGG